MRLLSAEDIVPDNRPLLAAAAAAAAASSEPTSPAQARRQQPVCSRPNSAPASTQDGASSVLAAQQTAFGTSTEQAGTEGDAGLACPSRQRAALDMAALRLRSTSSGLDGPAVAAAGLLALATAAGSCSPCSSPTSTGPKTLPDNLQGPADAKAAAVAADSDEADGAAQTLLACARPSMSAADALAAAFPVAPAAAAAAPGAARPRPRPAARAAAAAAVAHRPEDITASTLCVADVGTFMGHRMFKTPFACWASWLKEAGGCSGHVQRTTRHKFPCCDNGCICC
jgi:hypothetical protein